MSTTENGNPQEQISLPEPVLLLIDQVVSALGFPPSMHARARANLRRRYEQGGEEAIRAVLKRADESAALMRQWLDRR